MAVTLPTPELLRKLLRYEPETGKLFWRKRPVSMFRDGALSAKRVCHAWNNRNGGREAFTTLVNNGYRSGRIFNKRYVAHRVIWALHTGAWPPDQIDHIDHVRTNNRIANIRQATLLENCRNKTLQKNSTSGICGVSFSTVQGKWIAHIKINQKSIRIGQFETKHEAANARHRADIEHGFHVNHGK